MNIRPVVLVAILLIAGCADRAEPAGPGAAVIGPAEFDAATGGIEGVVTDDAFTPIVNATVELEDAGVQTTDAGGRFAFSRVPPGDLLLQALALGYEGSTIRVTVIAGEAQEVHLALTPLAVAEPYSTTVRKAGEVMCSGYLRVYGGLPGAIGLCVLVDNKFMTAWSWTDLDGLSGMWLETTWRSTQVAGGGLELYVPFGVGTTLYTYLARNLVGTNPIRHNVTGEAIDDFLTARGVKGGLEACPSRTCVMQIWHYVYGHLLGPSSQVDAGLLLQQKYEDYVTLFFHGEFPSTFTALPDA